MADKRDYYEILGVSKNASSIEIKRALRSLLRKYYPDIARSPEIDRKVKEASEAYEVLSNPQKRATYDKLGYVEMDSNAIKIQSENNDFFSFISNYLNNASKMKSGDDSK